MQKDHYLKISIEKQREEAIKSLSGAIRAAIPEKVYEAGVINLNKGKALAEMVTKEYQNNFEGNVIMINRWTKFLGIAGWFRWMDFEDVPANYMETF